MRLSEITVNCRTATSFCVPTKENQRRKTMEISERGGAGGGGAGGGGLRVRHGVTEVAHKTSMVDVTPSSSSQAFPHSSSSLNCITLNFSIWNKNKSVSSGVRFSRSGCCCCCCWVGTADVKATTNKIDHTNMPLNKLSLPRRMRENPGVDTKTAPPY